MWQERGAGDLVHLLREEQDDGGAGHGREPEAEGGHLPHHRADQQ